VTAAGRGAVSPLATYYTDPRVAHAVVRYLSSTVRGGLDGRIVTEGHGGGGAFVEALLGAGARVQVLDRDERASALAWPGIERSEVRSFLAPMPAEWPRPDLVVGNPPYTIRVPKAYTDPEDRDELAEARWEAVQAAASVPRKQTKPLEVATDHVLRAIEEAPVVAFVMGSGFQDGVKRYGRLHARGLLDEVLRLVPRPSFNGGGTDSAGSDLLIWRRDRDPCEPARHGWLRWR